MTSDDTSWARLTIALAATALLTGPTIFAAAQLLAAAGFVVAPGTAPKFGGNRGREQDVTELLATAEQTGGALGLVRQTVAPNSGPPAHIHHAEDEFFYVVSGE